MPLVIAWSIWLHRNEIVFQGKTADFGQLLYIVKLRASWWFKAKVPGSLLSLDLIFSDPSNACRKDYLTPKTALPVAWSPPPLGFLKFNVDGTCDKSGNYGVGGTKKP
ncbi:hypothetical protein GQ457_02G041360 [Hibiscus cannabinus]